MPPVLDPIGRFSEVGWIESTGSTNADVLATLRQDSAALGTGRVLITEEQTEGRGRRDRSWDMPAGGGLLLSIYVPWSNPVSVSLVPICLGIAAVDTVGEWSRSCQLKWPNDVVSAGGRKVAGMLSELVHDDGARLRGVVVGFGCNVSWPPAGYDALPGAVSLDRLGSGTIDRPAFARRLLERFDDELAELTRHGPARMLERYRQRSATIGADVRIEGIRRELVGRAVDVDPAGRLILLVDGELETVDVGDVVHLRPIGDEPGPDGDG